MCRKLIYLVSFVLALGLVLTSTASADLVGWWALDESSGDIAHDSSGKGNDGTVGGTPHWVAGKRGGAFDFDGVANYIYVNAEIRGSLSVCLWLYPRNIPYTSGYRSIMASDTWAGAPNSSLHVHLRNTTSLFNFDTNGGTDISAGAPAVANQWYHIGYTYNRDTGVANLYINGEPNNTATGPTGDLVLGPVTIGARTRNQRYFDGIMDDIRIYTHAITADEIHADMLGGKVELAYSPSPSKQAIEVPRDVTLSWKPGKFANTHDVYFGTAFADVNDADRANPLGVLVSQNQVPNSYSPAEVLQWEQTYYWRVDEVNAPPDFTTFKGEVWSFTVEPFAYPIAGTSITATASSQFNENTKPENTINGSGLDDNDLHSTKEAGIWLSSMTGAQPTWIQYEFDRVYKLHQMWVWNHNTSIEPVVGFGIKNATIEYSIDGANWAALGTTHEFARAPGAAGYAHNTTVDLSDVVAKYIKITTNSNWGGIMPQYGLSEVCFFYVPVLPREPDPASGATDINVDNVTLSWRTGREAAKHNVYFSDSNQAVIDGTAPVTSVSKASYGPLSLDLGKTYYWRVDEVNEAETPATWQGDVLNFTTREFLAVDDFEDYNDFEPDRIFDTWIDGWNVPANGSQVGYAAPPFAEKTIIHGGKQSMPLSYDNSTTASYSEATANIANLAIGKDWTKYGIKTLTLYFYGDPNNSIEQMYVKLNGSKVIYDGDAGNITRIGWQPWNIELSSLGVNLRNVTELIIGLERSGAVGGKGKVYFDDIRLYPYSRQLITPAEPSQAGLVGHWQFEGNLSDSSGNSRHGTPFGSPAYVVGKIGQAINLRGVNDYVEITGYKGILGGGAFSIAAWVKSTSTGDVTMVCWGAPTNGQRVDFRLGQGRLRVEHGNGNLQGNTILADGQWHHVALTVTENAPISYPAVKLYLDGSDDSQTTTDPDTFNIVANIDVNIGRRGTNNDRVFSGSLDDVRIYERVLTQEEVAGLAGRTKPFDKPF